MTTLLITLRARMIFLDNMNIFVGKFAETMCLSTKYYREEEVNKTIYKICNISIGGLTTQTTKMT